MRLLERTLKEIQIAPAEVKEDSLGACVEGFSENRIAARASVIPERGEMQAHESGRSDGRALRLLMALDAPIRVGDGVCLEDGGVLWRCVSVEAWSAHLSVRLEKRT